MSRKASLVKAATMLSMIGLTAVGAATLPTSASASGFYIGADVVKRTTDLDYLGGTETYDTSHVRIKGGYEILKFLAVEAHVLTAGNDTDIDPFGALYELDTGNIIGIYVKPKTNFAKANVYGLIGFAQWDTTYTEVATRVKDTDTVVTFGVGVGGEFNITKNLRFNIEGMIQSGSPSYSTFFINSPDLYSFSLAAGMSYKF